MKWDQKTRFLCKRQNPGPALKGMDGDTAGVRLVHYNPDLRVGVSRDDVAMAVIVVD